MLQWIVVNPTGTGGLTFVLNIHANSNLLIISVNRSGTRWSLKAYVDAGPYLNVTDAGGDGSLSVLRKYIYIYRSCCPEVRAHFSGGTGVTITDGSIAIGQAVNTGS